MVRLSNLQILRAIAALLVLYFHLGALGYSAIAPLAAGNAGVDIFFIISGFIIWATAHDAAPGNFAVRRLIRIVPLYWMLTLLLFLAKSLSEGDQIPVSELIKSILFIAYENPGRHPPVSPIIAPGWTLNMEMFFYLLFAIGLALFPRSVASWVFGVLVLLFAAGQVLEMPNIVVEFYTDSVILEFAIGILLAMFAMDTARKPPAWLAIAIGLLGIAILLAEPIRTNFRVLDYGLAAAMIVYASLALERETSAPAMHLAEYLGDASYAIYLVHVPLLGFMNRLMAAFDISPHICIDALKFLICILTGVAAHKYFDQPLQALLRHQVPKQSVRTQMR